MRKTFAIAVLALGMVSVAGAATITPELTDELGLVEIKSRNFDDIVAKNMSSLADVRDVYISDLDFSEVEVDEPDSYDSMREREFDLTEEDMQGLNEMYRASMVKFLEKDGKYRVVSEAGEGVLSVSASMLEIDPAAPKDDHRTRSVNARYYTEGAGDATISITVGSEDETYMVINDRRDAGRTWGVNDRFHNRHDVKMLFDSWARSLVKQLDS